MSSTKKDRSIRTSSGTSFQTDGRLGAAGLASAISDALHRQYGGARGAIKTIVGLTAANERAVKNWFEGHNGPSGEFLVALCRHSDEVLETVLMLAGRNELVMAKKFANAKDKLRQMLAMIDDLERHSSRDDGVENE